VTAWYAGQEERVIYIPDDVLIQFDSPDDEHWVARNMWRSDINKYIEKRASGWLLTRIIPRCKVNEILNKLFK
jgi:hypothetical protein